MEGGPEFPQLLQELRMMRREEAAEAAGMEVELVRELVMMRGEAGAEGEPVRERRLRMMRFMMGRPAGRRTFPRSLLVLHMKVCHCLELDRVRG